MRVVASREERKIDVSEEDVSEGNVWECMLAKKPFRSNASERTRQGSGLECQKMQPQYHNIGRRQCPVAVVAVWSCRCELLPTVDRSGRT